MEKQAVKDIKLRKGMSSDDLIKEFYKSGGFTAKKVAVGVDILKNMIKDRDCVKFLSFPACICSTGTRGVIRELLEKIVIPSHPLRLSNKGRARIYLLSVRNTEEN